jgi:serine protease
MISTSRLRVRDYRAGLRRGAVLAAALAALCGGPAAARAAEYEPAKVVVAFDTRTAAVRLHARFAAASAAAAAPSPDAEVLTLPKGSNAVAAAKTLSRQRGVAYAVPDYVAHAAGTYVPDDRGRVHRVGGWQATQWNFLAGAGVDAPLAWANLIAEGRPGGEGVIVAVLDTGVAYRDWHRYKASPDFTGTRFVSPYDFIDHNVFPLDREGHGTFVAGTIAEATNNGLGLTGLAYGASIMPVRVLDADGTGDAATIAKGIRYAVQHRAQVINLSLEFSLDVTAGDIPEITSAIRYAHDRGAVVVAAAGNEGVEQIAYPARTPAVISVGATTADKCLADYSNGGSGLDLVAPGGGDDSSLVQDPGCAPNKQLPTIYQMTIIDPSNPAKFGYPGGYYGTSMAAPHVTATAALIIASGVLGKRPTPDEILKRMEQTAQPLGGSVPNSDYGYGLLDAGAATTSGPPPPAATPTRKY